MSDPHRHRRAADAQRRIAEQAAAWHLEQRDGLDAAGRARFLAWLRRSPEHVAEYLAIARLHGELKGALAQQPDAAALCALAARESAVVPLRRTAAPVPAARPRRRNVRRVAAGLAGAAMLALFALLLSRPPAGEPPAEIYAAAADAGRALELPDGSAVQLDRGSAIAVRFDARARRIELLRGAAVFDVGRDARPLQVRLGANLLRDVGTVFAVRREAGGGSVAVLSGRVDVLAPPSRWSAAWHRLAGGDAGAAVLARLRGGEQARVDARGALAALDAHADLARATAWLPREIQFQRSTVAAVARRFNAYTTQPIEIDDPAVAAMRISGRFHAGDAAAFTAYLASLPGVHVTRADGRVRVAAAVRKNSSD